MVSDSTKDVQGGVTRKTSFAWMDMTRATRDLQVEGRVIRFHGGLMLRAGLPRGGEKSQERLYKIVE